MASQAKRVLEILMDGEQRNRMRWAARQTAETHFCTSKIIPRYEAVYRTILDGAQKP